MKKETIKRLIENFQNSEEPLADSLSSYLTDQLALERSILQNMSQIRGACQNLELQYKTDKNKWHHKLLQLQEQCPHHETTFYADASGGNDSETICDWCHKEL